MIVYLIYIVVSILFILSIHWELNDYKRIDNLPYINEIQCKKQKERHYRLLAKFPYENAIGWRMLFVTSVFVTLILWFVLHKAELIISKETLLVMFFVVFIGFELSAGFISFHVYRILASKADSHITTI